MTYILFYILLYWLVLFNFCIAYVSKQIDVNETDIFSVDVSSKNVRYIENLRNLTLHCRDAYA